MTSDLQAMLSALADPTRRDVFERLADGGPSTATEIARSLPVSRQAVARHLAVLDEAGLVGRSAVGREVRFSARPERLAEVVRWANDVGREWDRRMERLRGMVEH
jgi:DNA-binding transcriptional ArsR family regulator